MITNQNFENLISELSQCPEVEAILLAGSRGTGRADSDSDYDVYVYLNRELSITTRKKITSQYCKYMELNNQFWETEDDGILNDGTEIELIYRSLEWLEGELIRVVEHHQANIGYTTCFWSNLLDSDILFDRNNKAKALQERFSIDYPKGLKQAIVSKNFPLLMEQIPAYYHQMKKAIKRGDTISVNHRTAEFMAAYFDVLFAVNGLPHPGEKRMLEIAQQHCTKIPENMAADICSLLNQLCDPSDKMLHIVEDLTRHMQQAIEAEGIRV